MKAKNIPLSLLSAHFHLTDTSNDNIYRCGAGAKHTRPHYSPQIIGGGASHLERTRERKIIKKKNRLLFVEVACN